MYKLKNSLIAICYLSLLVGAMALGAPQPTQGQGDPVGPTKPVLVVNTSTQPVPVTGTITGDVNVVNTPTVGIDPTNNTVRVGEAPKQIFSMTKTIGLTGAQTFDVQEVFTVPAGKQLVITYLTMHSSCRDGVRGLYRVLVRRDLQEFPHSLAAVPTGQLGNEEFFVASVPLHLYLDAHDKLLINFVRDSTVNIAAATFSFSGYLVDVP